jgi:hypothetical protein
MVDNRELVELFSDVERERRVAYRGQFERVLLVEGIARQPAA